MGEERKIQIPNAHRGDITLLHEEAEAAIKKTLQHLHIADPVLEDAIKRRL